MVITAEAVPVYLALIGLVTLIVQGFFASRERAHAAEKLNEIHTLTNSGMSEVRSQLSTALARIEELNKAATMARMPAAQPPLPPTGLIQAATVAGVVAATAVADAAVDKKDEIVGKK